MSVAGTITDNDDAIVLKEAMAKQMKVDNRGSFWRSLALKSKHESINFIANRLNKPENSPEVLDLLDKLEDLKFSEMI